MSKVETELSEIHASYRRESDVMARTKARASEAARAGHRHALGRLAQRTFDIVAALVLLSSAANL